MESQCASWVGGWKDANHVSDSVRLSELGKGYHDGSRESIIAPHNTSEEHIGAPHDRFGALFDSTPEPKVVVLED